MYAWFNTRTAELVLKEIELLEVREVADGRRDGACAWAREFLCTSMSGHTLARTAEAAVAEVEFRRVLDGAEFAREREALVAGRISARTGRGVRAAGAFLASV